MYFNKFIMKCYLYCIEFLIFCYCYTFHRHNYSVTSLNEMHNKMCK